MQVVDAEPGEGAPKGDWFSTHPFSPLRVRALDYFHQSELMGESGLTQQTLELKVQNLMGLMEPSYIEGKTESAEAMRRLLFAGAIAVASASGGVSDAEVEIFEEFFGKGSFNEELNIEKLDASINYRAEKVKRLASRSQRHQLLRDLVLVANADNRIVKKERKKLVEIAEALDVHADEVENILSVEYELD